VRYVKASRYFRFTRTSGRCARIVALNVLLDFTQGMARQSGRERRGDQDEKRQPNQNMIAPSRHRRKPLLMVPRSGNQLPQLVVAGVPLSV